MTDRRHILTKSRDGNVALWDVLGGGLVRTYGKVRVCLCVGGRL